MDYKLEKDNIYLKEIPLLRSKNKLTTKTNKEQKTLLGEFQIWPHSVVPVLHSKPQLKKVSYPSYGAEGVPRTSMR